METRERDGLTRERDRLEILITSDPLWAAEELLQLKQALETIQSLVHEDGSQVAYRALQSPIWKD